MCWGGEGKKHCANLSEAHAEVFLRKEYDAEDTKKRKWNHSENKPIQMY